MKTRNRKISSVALALCMAYGLAAPAMADTASNMRGHITNTSGVAVTDVTVSIVHEPTGSIRKVKVDSNGNFSARGLRVGGPYKIILDSESLADDTIEGVYLNVGETFRLNRSLSSQDQIESFSVVGSASLVDYADANYFGAQAIENSPSIDRDLKDTLRQNPFAVVSDGGDGSILSVAGLNPKYNSFVVDGVTQNDDFGLNGNGYPSQRSPISVDAVQSVALDIAPFSARKGGFSGAQVNVVTKSGTNEVEGSVFYEYSSDKLAGRKAENDEGDVLENRFQEKTYGLTLGMPIIEDKLFFFGSYEKFDAPTVQEYTPGGANPTKTTPEQLAQVKQIAANKYGLSNIGVADNTPVEKDEKLLLKVDWTINDAHRASFTHQSTVGNRTHNTSNSRRLNLSSNQYDKEEDLKTYSFNLYSDWNDDFSTEFKIAHKNTQTSQQPVENLNIGHVQVDTDRGVSVHFGTDQYRQANALENQNLEVYFAGDYLLEEHSIGFGFQFNKLDVENLFVPAQKGYWRFFSIADFEAGKVGRFAYNNAASKNLDQLSAKIDMSTLALFVEDTWTVTDDLELNFGLRYEKIFVSNEPQLNQNFVKRYGFANNATLDGKDILLPRIGFNYTLTDDITVKGGIGRFSGGKPTVWIANTLSGDGVTRLSNFRWNKTVPQNFDTIPSDIHSGLKGGDGNVDALAPDFKLPSDWRFNLGVNSEWNWGILGDKWEVAADFLYIKQENDVAWKDLARQSQGKDSTGRTVYRTCDFLKPHGPNDDCSTSRYDILFTNAKNNGHSATIALTLAKEWDNGFRFRTSYAHNRVKEGFPGTSSQASSNYKHTATAYDRNEAYVGTGRYETPHNFNITLGYQTELFSGYKTNVNLFYNARKGRPLSLTMIPVRNGGFKEQSRLFSFGAYLPYLPTGADDAKVNYEDGFSYADLKKVIDELGISKYQGQILPKGVLNSPWTRQLDLNFSQEIPGFSEEHRGVLYFNIRNVLNMLNKDWGINKRSRFGNKAILEFDYNPQTKSYTYGPREFDSKTYDEINSRRSNWEMKVGIKYKF
ncbi:TonB-dependent receptor [Parashewanella curva]|uniref:TonB-dependent receptor n=1 Tax=Parashewanella curva TaxID=2338552 RepID=A0A3L8Q2Q7_9GAMM|nr:TonB-dependent receptor [Parashewanella curva]RLV61193.1 TonB-dependent receptor [Parashewanella curva]